MDAISWIRRSPTESIGSTLMGVGSSDTAGYIFEKTVRTGNTWRQMDE